MSGDESAVRNVVGGNAEIIVQAGQVTGGVHFHGRRREPARLVPPPTPHFTNQLRVLAEADAAVTAQTQAGPRILVFSGPPGVGKREVARFWLRRHSDLFPDGQFHADLSGGLDDTGLESARLRDFLLAADVDAAAIPDSAEGRAAAFRSWSTGKRVAVSVDKAMTPRQVRMLSPGPGPSVMLVTAAGPLSGLTVRDAVTFIDLAPFSDDAARELLGRMVGTVRTEGEPDAVEALVRLCAGLPIALCVVGALLVARPTRKIARLVAELSDERRRLAALSRDDDLSVTAVFNTAYRRLSPAAQRCYRAFGVHPGMGDVGVDVLLAALGDGAEDAVDELVSAGLLRSTADERYVPHALVRLHAHEAAAAAADESAAVAGRMVEHYRRTAVAAGHAAMPLRGWLTAFFGEHLDGTDGTDGTAPDEPAAWLEVERTTLRAVVEQLYDDARFADVCLLAVALWPLHERGKHADDLIEVNTRAVTAARELGRADLLALATTQLGFGYLHGGDSARAHKTFRQAVEAADAAGVVELRATALESLGLAAIAAGREDDAVASLRANLALAEEIGVPRRLALARLHLAKVTGPDESLALLDAALAGFVGLEPVDDYNAAKARLWLGRTLTRLSRFSEARESLDAALAVMRSHRRPFDQAQVLEAIGDLDHASGDTAAATDRYRESLAITESSGFVGEARRVQGKVLALSAS
ncbi:tetratricopeptide repeat protein [Actinokineospora iranica]|uniref:NB-ARC domain-containing protein n=1 Tax=Actinokineospora iranica TaxID=1271860 RepID=A0A1G6Z5L0_9PSEU|nr:tetratricopeptide repeat protein [Actinokineospora iranica]SDD97155.1 NB-ARC domain-containing protein [Actinokineospora iranica]